MTEMQQTSLQAYDEIKPELGKRQREVYMWLREHGPATNTMISQGMNLPINCITPRVVELREKKKVGVAYIQQDMITGRRAIFWQIVA
jgi:hypothetical protein